MRVLSLLSPSLHPPSFLSAGLLRRKRVAGARVLSLGSNPAASYLRDGLPVASQQASSPLWVLLFPLQSE